MTSYLTTLAWIFGSLSTILIILRLLAFFTYSELDKLQDALRGGERTFPIFWPAVVSIVCWTWVLK